MKLHKFIGVKSVPLNQKELLTTSKILQTNTETKLSPKEELITSTWYREQLPKTTYKGTKNGKQFTASPSNISIIISKDKGYIEGQPKSQSSSQYSASVKLYGSKRYKHQRHWNAQEHTEIVSKYTYDTDLIALLQEVVKFYSEIKGII